MALFAIVGVDHVASGAAGRTIIARVIVSPEKVQSRIKQAAFSVNRDTPDQCDCLCRGRAG